MAEKKLEGEKLSEFIQNNVKKLGWFFRKKQEKNWWISFFWNSNDTKYIGCLETLFSPKNIGKLRMRTHTIEKRGNDIDFVIKNV